MLRLLPNAVIPCLALALALEGCHKQATGQVAAVVNGDEITMQEVNTELGPARIDAAHRDRARSAVMQRLIDKRLLEQEAKAAGLDRNPDYLLRRRQMDQALLIEFYVKRAQDTLRVPDETAIDRFVAAHPFAFAKRMLLTIDQVRFQPPKDAAMVDRLRTLPTFDAVVSALHVGGIAIERTTGKVDSAQLPATLAAQVISMPMHKPFIVPTPQGLVAGVVTDRLSTPVAAVDIPPIAARMMRAQALEQLVGERLKDARAKAKVSYQTGYAPIQRPN